MSNLRRTSKLAVHLAPQPTAAGAKSSAGTGDVKALRGRCACGACSWEGIGAPAMTFYCHCSLCRRSGGAAYVAAAAFKPENAVFHGESSMREFTPPGSKVARRFCAKCGSYLAEDARPVLGVFALPLGLCEAESVDQDVYAPTQHIFYGSRVVDCGDQLPKWKDMPDGERMG